jgi:TRAP transporter TAXI family solute receptor
MKRFKVNSVLLLSLLLVLFLTVSVSATQYLSIATGGMAGTYYPVGGAISSIINANIEGISSTVESTGATVANCNLIKSNSTELAITAANITYNAFEGIEGFDGKDPIKNMAGITCLYPETVQFVTLEKSGIKSVLGLKGKKVAVGMPGSGTEVMAREIFEVYGMSYDDITEDFIGSGEVATGLKDNTISAGFIWSGIPTALIVDIASRKKIRIIAIDRDKLDALKAKLPYCADHLIKAGTYHGFNEDVMSVAIPAMLVCSTNLSEDLVYNITKVIFEHTEDLIAAHTRGRDITLETALNGMSIPLHPGAEKYYKEVGLIK